MENEIRLTEEMFTALLQGKKLNQIYHLGGGQTKEWTIYPPHYGLYLTQSQLSEIKRAAYQSGMTAFIDLIDRIETEKDVTHTQEKV